MITNKTFWTVAIALAFAGIAGYSAVALRFSTPGTVRCDDAWAFVADSAPSLVWNSEAIVFAETVAVHPGRVASSDGGEDLLPFQIVEFKVSNTLKGSFPDGRLFVERAGGFEPVNRVFHTIDIDGGEFVLGHSYLLFLNEQPGDTGLFYQVNDQGRYELIDGRLQAIDPDGDRVQQLFQGRKRGEATAMLRKLIG